AESRSFSGNMVGLEDQTPWMGPLASRGGPRSSSAETERLARWQRRSERQGARTDHECVRTRRSLRSALKHAGLSSQTLGFRRRSMRALALDASDRAMSGTGTTPNSSTITTDVDPFASTTWTLESAAYSMRRVLVTRP